MLLARIKNEKKTILQGCTIFWGLLITITSGFFFLQTRARLLEARLLISKQFFSMNAIEQSLSSNDIIFAHAKIKQMQNISAQYILYRDVQFANSLFAMDCYYDLAYNQLATNQIESIELFINKTKNKFHMSAGWNLNRYEIYFLTDWFDFFGNDYSLWENTPLAPSYKIVRSQSLLGPINSIFKEENEKMR